MKIVIDRGVLVQIFIYICMFTHVETASARDAAHMATVPLTIFRSKSKFDQNSERSILKFA